MPPHARELRHVEVAGVWAKRSAAYQVARQNLETWLARRRTGGLAPGEDWVVGEVPGYVERDLRSFRSAGFWRPGLPGRAVRSAVRTFR